MVLSIRSSIFLFCKFCQRVREDCATYWRFFTSSFTMNWAKSLLQRVQDYHWFMVTLIALSLGLLIWNNSLLLGYWGAWCYFWMGWSCISHSSATKVCIVISHRLLMVTCFKTFIVWFRISVMVLSCSYVVKISIELLVNWLILSSLVLELIFGWKIFQSLVLLSWQ